MGLCGRLAIYLTHRLIPWKPGRGVVQENHVTTC